MTTTTGATSHDVRDNHDGDLMLTIIEAAEYLRTPVGTMRWWRHCGTGPRSFRIGRSVRYWKTDIILWLADQTNRP